MKYTVSLSGIAAAVALALSSAPGNAEDQPLEQVTVTGTHLGQGLTSYTPISSVSETQLSQLGTVNVEEFLNSMPQVAAGENNTSNFPGNGTASIDLRGFGANRTLVLVSGGTKAGDEAMLDKARESMDAGATGLIFGRNVWQREHDESLRLVAQLRDILAKHPTT